MHRARFWILCAMGALVVISGILLIGFRDRVLKTKSLKNMLPANVDMRLDNLTLTETGSGDRTLIVNAANAQYYKTQDLFILENVKARILADQGDYNIVADTGRYEQGRRIINLKGNIRVIDSDSGVLSCDELTLKFEEGILTSADPFCYATPTADLEGTSFVYYTKEKLLKVEGRTHLLVQ